MPNSRHIADRFALRARPVQAARRHETEDRRRQPCWTVVALVAVRLPDAYVERRALDAQRQLARVGHHRLPPVDLLVAAVADRYELGVLHYDGDYDVLAEKTDLRFGSVWLARAGML
jgi:predicted nucleic acid-binding protein